ncbi:MAG: amino acid ABC transporter permease [Mycobacterium sp.]
MTSTTAAPVESTMVPIKARAQPRPGRWVGGIVLVAIVALLVRSLWTNPRLEKGVILDYLFRELTLRGLWVTLWLTVLAMAIGIIGGTMLAVMGLSRNPVLVGLSSLYLWVFRGTPVLVQIIFWGYLGALYPQLVLGVPFTDLVFVEAPTSAVITGTTAAILALGLNEAAYAAEIIRAGIQAVDHGQTEACQALGMPSGLAMRRVVLPQAMRVIIPPMGNETIGMLKTTSLVSVISGHDLLTNMQNVYSQTFEVIPLLVVASIWYLTITSILTVGQRKLERHFGRGVAGRHPGRGRPRSRLARIARGARRRAGAR